MLDSKRREFIALLGGGALLLAAKVKRARGQQSAMPVVGLLGSATPTRRPQRSCPAPAIGRLFKFARRPPPRLGDLDVRDLDRLAPGDNALGLRSCELEAHQHGHPTSFIK